MKNKKQETVRTGIMQSIILVFIIGFLILMIFISEKPWQSYQEDINDWCEKNPEKCECVALLDGGYYEGCDTEYDRLAGTNIQIISEKCHKDFKKGDVISNWLCPDAWYEAGEYKNPRQEFRKKSQCQLYVEKQDNKIKDFDEECFCEERKNQEKESCNYYLLGDETNEEIYKIKKESNCFQEICTKARPKTEFELNSDKYTCTSQSLKSNEIPDYCYQNQTCQFPEDSDFNICSYEKPDLPECETIWTEKCEEWRGKNQCELGNEEYTWKCPRGYILKNGTYTMVCAEKPVEGYITFPEEAECVKKDECEKGNSNYARECSRMFLI